MKFELNQNDPELNWNLALLVTAIIFLFILFNYGIAYGVGIQRVNTGNFLEKNI
jgi:hypothetical protein